MEKTPRQNRVKEALGRIYDHHPPYFREYLRRYQEDPTSRVFAPLAEAYRRMGRVEDAIGVCREGLEHHPDFHGGRVTLAKCFLDKKMFPEAQVELEKVIQFSPENLLAQRLLGETYNALGDKRSALHCFKMALLLSPADVTLAEKVHRLEQELSVPNQNESQVNHILASSPGNMSANLSDSFADETTRTDKARLDAATLASQMGDEFKVVDRVTLDASNDLPPLWDIEKKPAEPPAPLPSKGIDVDTLLGGSQPSDDAFKVGNVKDIFDDASKEQEITTGTLGDLYFSQGQIEQSLKIFEKLAEKNPSPDLIHKINICRARLGVDRESRIRNRQIAVLRALLRTLPKQNT